KKDAENLLKQRIGEVAAGRRVGSEKATIEDLCNLVIADAEMRKLDDVQHVKWRYVAHIKPIFGSLLASRFGQAQIREYIKQRRAEDASNGTINRELAIVRRGFRLGAQEEPPFVLRQPAFPMLKENNVRQGFIERPQYETLLAELPENLRALFVCGYHVGARKNELRRIEWDQVDFEARVIRLTAGQTKAKVSRVLPIYGDVELWLRKQQETAPPRNRYVFHGARGCPVDNHLLGWGRSL
ncbi:MAG TPA: tyrosine-type recombinase/integrase, partial [Bryobacteraceae bacterium]